MFPPVCSSCKQQIYSSTAGLCLQCLSALESSYQKSRDHDLPLYNCPVEKAKSIYTFEKSNPIQILLHKIKYSQRLDLIPLVFQSFIDFNELLMESYEAIVPVPLHPRKKRKRGYNQSEYFAKILSQKNQVPIEANVLKRIRHTKSQVKKDREERVWGLEGVFEAQHNLSWTGKRILLIDDVMTTGTTLRSCVKAIRQQNPEVKITILVIAAVF